MRSYPPFLVVLDFVPILWAFVVFLYDVTFVVRKIIVGKGYATIS